MTKALLILTAVLSGCSMIRPSLQEQLSQCNDAECKFARIEEFRAAEARRRAAMTLLPIYLKPLTQPHTNYNVDHLFVY